MSQHWQQQIKKAWGLDGTITPLAGYLDENFLLKTSQQRFVFKVMHTGYRAKDIDLQIRAMNHLNTRCPNLPIPTVIPTINDAVFCESDDENNQPRLCWLITALDGHDYAKFSPQEDHLIHQTGHYHGEMISAFKDFQHDALIDRQLDWDLMQATWLKPHIADMPAEKQAIFSSIMNQFECDCLPLLKAMPHRPIHNDLNDYNILSDGKNITGLIDFGDMVMAPRICDIAIAATYIALDHEQPIKAIEAYLTALRNHITLDDQEISLLWPLIKVRLMTSLIVSTLSQREKPDDPYITISAKPVEALLSFGEKSHPRFVETSFRLAAGLSPFQGHEKHIAALKKESANAKPIIDVDLSNCFVADFSIDGLHTVHNPLDMDHLELDNICQTLHKKHDVFLGRYGEPRLLYTQPAYYHDLSSSISLRRTVHMGCDIFAKPGTAIMTPLDATVMAVQIAPDHLDYGGHILLKHDLDDGISVFTLYGHLHHDCAQNLTVGQKLTAGETIGHIGDLDHSGGWASHVHFQLGYFDMNGPDHWPGAIYPDQFKAWQHLFPNPAELIGIRQDKIATPILDDEAIIQYRQKHSAKNLKTSYDQPLQLVRGFKHYLFDQWGKPYLDAYNNVPHVGHCHPDVTTAVAHQTAMINTNTRYLHRLQKQLSDQILDLMPNDLDTVLFVPSGSEANELALRIARAYTGSDHIITPKCGYHGHTNAALAISDYKFSGPGGRGQASWVHTIDLADIYRFDGSNEEAIAHYEQQLKTLLNTPQTDGAITNHRKNTRIITKTDGASHRPYSFISEIFPSVGGQIIPPKGYLSMIYENIRAHGGLIIGDEVQTGLGRLGHYMFGFEQQEVVPDIVVLGKPLGNGYPLAAVITRQDIIHRFDPGMEFFSTFGGSTAALAAGSATLTTLKHDQLQENAKIVGDYLINRLKSLAEKQSIIGNVRGLGLFIGVDLVKDQQTKEPHSDAAQFIKNQLKEKRILIGTDGQYDHVLKIRPPLTITKPDCDLIISAIDKALDKYAILVP
mgnify:CR=1 FL=1